MSSQKESEYGTLKDLGRYFSTIFRENFAIYYDIRNLLYIF